MRPFILFVTFWTISILCISCGDLLEKKIKIADEYYLIENSFRGGLSIYYKSSTDDFVERIPNKVIAYAINDHFVVAKCPLADTVIFYLIDRAKDSQFAESKDYLLGPFTITQFDSLAIRRQLNIQLKQI